MQILQFLKVVKSNGGAVFSNIRYTTAMNQLLYAIGCFFLFVPATMLPQSQHPLIEESYKVVLSEGSKLSILGRTNVNHFQCKYTETIEPEVLQVNVRSAANGLYFSNAYIQLQTIFFKCGPSQMNQDLQAFLKVKEHPYASIRLIKVDISGDQILNKPRQEAMSLMEITLAGVTKKYQIPVSITNEGGEYGFSGSLDLNICDFNLDPPVVMMGLIRVKEEVKVDFKLKACIEKVIIH
jgi:hypothetical protein